MTDTPQSDADLESAKALDGQEGGNADGSNFSGHRSDSPSSSDPNSSLTGEPRPNTLKADEELSHSDGKQSDGKRSIGLQRGLQWLSLVITIPFLGINGLAAWQVHSLTHYSEPNPENPPLFARSPLKRVGELLLGVKIPRPENDYSPADLRLAFESHRIDLGNGEYLDGWYVPAPKQEEEKAQTKPEVDEVEASASNSVSSSEADVTTEVTSDDAIPGLAVVSETVQSPEKQGVVLLFPAYAASKQTLLQEVKLLYRLGYASFAVDLRGVGDSSGRDTTLGPREAEDVAATMEYVAQTFDNPPMALYGRILGAGHVLRAIAEFDLQPNALLLEDPHAQLFSLTESVVESVGLPRSPTTQLLIFWGGLLTGEDPSAYDPIRYASEITTPTLVIYGAEDSWVSFNEVVGVHGQLQGTKEIVGLSSAKMMPISVSAYPSWLERVGAFLDANMGQ